MDSGANELGEITENIASVPLSMPVHGVASLAPLMLCLGAEEMAEAEVEEGDHSIDRPVRVIHLICLFHH